MQFVDTSKTIKRLNKADITRGGDLYKSSYFDEINTTLLLDKLYETSDRDDLALVLPETPAISVLVVIHSLLCLLEFDSSGSSFNVADLKEGDHVIYDSGGIEKPSIFEGSYEQDGQLVFKLNVEDGAGKHGPIIEHVTWERRHKILPYNPKPKSDKRHKPFSMNLKSLSRRMMLNKGDLLNLQSRCLLVANGKAKFIESIKNLSVYGRDMGSVFPVSEYKSSRQGVKILGDPAGRKSVLCLATSVDLATDIALTDRQFKLVIIEGASKIKNSYSQIKKLNADDYPRRIVCLLQSTDVEELQMLRKIGFDTWAYRKSDFLNSGKGHPPSSTDQEGIFAKHDAIISNLECSKTDLESINDPVADLLFGDLASNIQGLSVHTDESDPVVGEMINRVWRLFMLFRSLPITIQDFEQSMRSSGKNTLEQHLEDLRRDSRQVSDANSLTYSSEQVAALNGINECLDQLYRHLYGVNRKQQAITDALDKANGATTIICSNEEMAEVIRESGVFDHPQTRVTVISQYNLDWQEPIKNTIICGYLSANLYARSVLAPFGNCLFLLYPQEEKSFNRKAQNNPITKMSNHEYQLRRRFPKLALDNERQSKRNASTKEELNDSDSLWQQITEKFADATNFSNPNRGAFVLSEHKTEAYKIRFEDQSHTFISKDGYARRLNREGMELERVDYRKLEIGDELIFIESSRDILQSLLDRIFDKSDRLRSLRHESSGWWRRLKEYSDRHNLKAADITGRLRQLGYKRHEVTITSWLKGRIIEPLDSDRALKAIANITGDTRLKENAPSIIRACKKIKALHIKVGRLLVGEVLKSVVMEEKEDSHDDDLDPSIRKKIRRYAKQAKIRTVSFIADDSNQVPDNVLGELFNA